MPTRAGQTIAVTGCAGRRPAATVTHVRENRGALAELERRALVRIATRLPAWVTSDQLSALGLLGMFGAGAAFVAGARAPRALLLVVAALGVNWFGDSLDGTLARVRNRQRPRYGYYLDHVLDIIGITALISGLAVSGFMSPVLAASLLAAYVAAMAEVFLATATRGVFRMSFLGLGPTELRIVLAAGAIALMRGPWVHLAGLGPLRLFDVGGACAICGLVAAFVVAAVGNARALARVEPLPGR